MLRIKESFSYKDEGVCSDEKINLLIVTGMSGAGKSVVLNSLEDVGYHCIDNFPPKLLPKLTDLIMGTSEHVVNLAVVIDLRSLDFDSIDEMLYFLQDSHYVNVHVLYLDASDETLVKRYKETRRTHPLSRDTNLLDGIHKERKLLKPIYDISDFKIDTSGLPAKELKKKLLRSMVISMEITLASLLCHSGLNMEHRLIQILCLMCDFYPIHFI